MTAGMTQARVPARLRRAATAEAPDPVEFLRDVLQETSSYREAAERLGVSESTLYRWRRVLIEGEDIWAELGRGEHDDAVDER